MPSTTANRHERGRYRPEAPGELGEPGRCRSAVRQDRGDGEHHRGDRLVDEVRGERDDDRLHAQIRDDRAVQETGAEPDRERDGDHHLGARSDVPVRDAEDDGDVDQSKKWPDRDVDAPVASEDRDGDGDREDDCRRGARDQLRKGIPGEESTFVHGVEHDEHDDEEARHRRVAVLAERPPWLEAPARDDYLHRAHATPNIAAAMASRLMSVSVSWGFRARPHGRRARSRKAPRVPRVPSKARRRRRRDRPRPARSRGVLRLVGRSTPRVGSSSSRTLGSAASNRPRRTFCWLPPLRDVIGMSGDASRMCMLERATSNRRSSDRRLMLQRRSSIFSVGKPKLSRIESGGKIPWEPRFRGRYMIPCRHASNRVETSLSLRHPPVRTRRPCRHVRDRPTPARSAPDHAPQGLRGRRWCRCAARSLSLSRRSG